jgi:hypothetical protein
MCRSFHSDEEAGIPRGLADAITSRNIFELYLRLADTRDFPEEDGPAGARDATVRPLVSGTNSDGRPIAAPVLEIVHMLGRYAGGRWVLANCSGSITAEGIEILATRALIGAVDIVCRPSFACYYPGEVPAFTVQFRRPRKRAGELLNGSADVKVMNADGKVIEASVVRLAGEESLVTGKLVMTQRDLEPGLYTVEASQLCSTPVTAGNITAKHTTGFWVFDRALLSGGDPITVDEWGFSKGGSPMTVTGTTYMASDVHRKFLFEPNVAVWDKDFGAMRDAGINMVRTGIWTAWRHYMLDVGAPSEALLRAADAFVLTARKHDIPLIFTFFAFLPEMWNGENPYLDPRSVDAQKEFIMAFTHRYGEVNDMIWDFINEPSFCSPRELWSCRPNYDRHESNAWNTWLKSRYPADTVQEHRRLIENAYRITSGEDAELPAKDEFADVNIFDDRRPVKVIDYRLFAQDHFRQWVEEMTKAVRSNGNHAQLITVGQDEGGTYDRPGPHFFGDVVDFTSLHNWWNNADLLWDSVMTKVPGKPNLVEETGVMFYQKMDGAPWRTETEAANLLEKKLAIAVGSGGGGFIEWIWNTNPYMKSDNEAAIGLHRSDGTAKPELEPLIRYARFLAKHRELLRKREREDVMLLIPHSQMFSTRNFATEATRRAVRALAHGCGVIPGSVSEYRVGSLGFTPKLMIVPAPVTLADGCWEELRRLAGKGATIVITGTFDVTDRWMPANRLKDFGLAATDRPVAQEETIVIDGIRHRLTFRGDKLQRLQKAVIPGQDTPEVAVVTEGRGAIVWSPLPVELDEDPESAIATYRLGMKKAGMLPLYGTTDSDPSVLILPLTFGRAILYTLVSEGGSDALVTLTDRRTSARVSVALKAQRTSMILLSLDNGKEIDRTE